jgi:hypothetical protein
MTARWDASKADPDRRIDVRVLRELFRHLMHWETLFESDAVDVLTGPDGAQYHLSDIQYLYECRKFLSPRQKQAIELCLYHNVKEKEATKIMAVSETNPVMMYATTGLRKIILMIENKELPRYRHDGEMPSSTDGVAS